MKIKLKGEVELWKNKWTQFQQDKQKPLPETAALVLEECDKDLFEYIYFFLNILMTLPVSVASAERSFSALRRLKSWLRSTMDEDRLSGLAFSNVHRDINVKVDNIIQRFSTSGKRNLDFTVFTVLPSSMSSNIQDGNKQGKKP